MKLSDLRIGIRLALAFGTILVLLAVISAINIVELQRIEQNADAMEAAAERERLAEEWLRAIETNVVRTGAASRTADAAEEKRYKDEIAATRERVNQVQKDLESAISSDKGRELLAAIAERRKSYTSTRDTILAAKAAAGTEGASAVAGRIDAEFVPQSRDYIRSVNVLVTHLKDEFKVAHGDLHARSTNGKIMLLSASAASLLLGALLAWWLTRSITTPLNQAVAVAEAVSSGDLTSRIDTPSRDEVGHLLHALGRMNESLRKIVTEVRSSTQGTAAASQQIAAGNQDLSARTEQQAGALEETASAMEELTSTVRQNAENALQANTLAVSASQTAEKGGVVVGDVVQTMESIHEASRKVVDIISVIDGIAFQTNILALNAAVEAARAGEQGRGFAVVAAEVRTLAQRSAAAAKEIKLLIDDSANKVEQGMQQVHGAGQTMQEIVGGVKRVSDIISEIAAASKEQTSGIEQINKAITQMDQVTQQNAALVEESAASAMALRDQAEKLSHSVDAFRLGDHVVARPTSPVVPVAARVAPVKAPAVAAVIPAARSSARGGDDWTEF